MWCRPLPEQLIGGQFAVEDVSLRQANDRFQIRRHEAFDSNDLVREAGRHFVEHVECSFGQITLLSAPRGSAPELVRRMTAKDVDDVLTRWRQRIVNDRGYDSCQERLGRIPAVLGVIVGSFQVVDSRRDVYVGWVPELQFG